MGLRWPEFEIVMLTFNNDIAEETPMISKSTIDMSNRPCDFVSDNDFTFVITIFDSVSVSLRIFFPVDVLFTNTYAGLYNKYYVLTYNTVHLFSRESQ